MKAQFLIEMPTPAGVKDEGFALYDFGDQCLKWSAPFPLPALGTRVYITMNNIGWASVEGFFAEDGFLGVMTRAENPPQWLRDQRKRDLENPRHADNPEWWKKGIGCEFGAEIALDKPGPRVVKPAPTPEAELEDALNNLSKLNNDEASTLAEREAACIKVADLQEQLAK